MIKLGKVSEETKGTEEGAQESIVRPDFLPV